MKLIYQRIVKNLDSCINIVQLSSKKKIVFTLLIKILMYNFVLIVLNKDIKCWGLGVRLVYNFVLTTQ